MVQFIMQEIPISKFKATCLSVMERVRKTRQPVRVTRFGDPVAEIVPPTPARPPEAVSPRLAGARLADQRTLAFSGKHVGVLRSRAEEAYRARRGSRRVAAE